MLPHLELTQPVLVDNIRTYIQLYTARMFLDDWRILGSSLGWLDF